MEVDKPLILVLCTGNSARSQMAEGFLRKYHGDRFEVASAGTDPKPSVHPLAVRAMDEAGVDISAQQPKDFKRFRTNPKVAHVLIVCDHANQQCPRTWMGDFTRTFMPFEDPAAAGGTEAQQLTVFRRVRDEIEQAMRNWDPRPGRAAGGDA
jgi:arsenate reductase